MDKDTIKIHSKNCLMVAHRGVSGVERENTCPAFVTAGVKSYYGIETDVRITKDGKFVLLHDDSTKRLSAVDVKVSESTYDELQQVCLFDVDGETTRTDLKIPTLADYIKVCRKYGKEAVLEIKGTFSEEQVVEACQIIDGLGWLDHTTIIAFSREVIISLRKHYKNVTAQFLSWHASDDEIAFMIEQNVDADIDQRNLTKEFVDKAHALGKKVNCWTVNTLEDAEKVMNMGVDYITTNILE